MTFIIDIDNTICKTYNNDYINSTPNIIIINKINSLYFKGNKIILFTSRNMRTFKGNLTLINKYTRPILEEWLNRYNIKYHELIMGKPWGEDVFYIDDRNLTIKQFINNTDYNICIKENYI